jgi:hypothetical protein
MDLFRATDDLLRFITLATPTAARSAGPEAGLMCRLRCIRMLRLGASSTKPTARRTLRRGKFGTSTCSCMGSRDGSVQTARRPRDDRFKYGRRLRDPLYCGTSVVAGTGFEPVTSGLSGVRVTCHTSQSTRPNGGHSLRLVPDVPYRPRVASSPARPVSRIVSKTRHFKSSRRRGSHESQGQPGPTDITPPQNDRIEPVDIQLELSLVDQGEMVAVQDQLTAVTP